MLHFVYVLELEGDYAWGGVSANPAKLLRQHTRRRTDPPCRWTTLHPPRALTVCTPVEEGRSPDEALEEAIIDAMARRGVARVRGGAYSTVTLPSETRQALRQRASARRAEIAEARAPETEA